MILLFIKPTILLTPRAMLLGVAVGVSVGTMIGLLADRFTKREQPGLLSALLIDAALGAIGFVGGAAGFSLLPMMQQTTTRQVGGMILRTTTRNYQDPYRLAFGTAALLAILFEFFRARVWRKRTSSSVKPERSHS